MTEAIYGLDTSSDDAARLMFKFISNDWIKVETALFTGKWFDYRFLNPVQATYLYAHYFEKAYRNSFASNIDTEKAQWISPLPKGDWFTLPERLDKHTPEQHAALVKRRKMLISGLWRGRQVADAVGMPYDLFLERALYWRLRYWNKSHLPRPSHLYSDLVTDRATIDWEDRQKYRLYFSKLPQYQNNAYAEIMAQMNDGDFEGKILQSQNAHHEWLFEQAAMRGNTPEVLSTLIFDEKVLPEIKVRGRIGKEAFLRVLAVTDRNPDQSRYN